MRNISNILTVKYTDIVPKVEAPKPVSKKKKDAKNKAIERRTAREALLHEFMDKYKLYDDDDIVRGIRKILFDKRTANIKLEAYAEQLNLLGHFISADTFYDLTEIVSDNAMRGYVSIVFPNQLDKFREYSSKGGRNTKSAKSNVSADMKSAVNSRDCYLSDFDENRRFLNNPDDDEELYDFVVTELGFKNVIKGNRPQ